MKRFCVALALLLLAGSVNFAQDPKPAGEVDPAVQLMNLYRVKGRSWSHREIIWARGNAPVVTTTNWYVKGIKDGVAEVTHESKGADVKFKGSREVKLSHAAENERRWAAKNLVEVELNVGFRSFRCKKLVTNTDERQQTTWVSTEFHPLVVKQVTMESHTITVYTLSSFLEAPVDPWLLYRKQGRRWTQETSIRIGGKGGVGLGSTSKMQYRVKEARENSASWTMSVLDANGKPSFSQDQEMQFTSGAIERDSGPIVDTSMQLKSCQAGEFLCWYTKQGGYETWSSVNWPGVLVAMAAKDYSMELIEFDLGHDEQAFFRAQGNSYELSTTSGGSTTKVRCEVTQLADGQATCRTVSLDADGKEVSVTVSVQEVSELPETLMAYAGQVEELVVTPAGSFPAIRTKDDSAGRTTWKWNGIIVREVVRGPEGETVSELTALNLQ